MRQKRKNRLMVPYFWELFRRYMNNPDYCLSQSDIMADHFGRGDNDVRDLINNCNKRSSELGIGVIFRYRTKMTFGKLLKQLKYEQI